MGEMKIDPAIKLAREAIEHSEWDASDEGEILAGKWDNAVAIRIAAHTARYILAKTVAVNRDALFNEAVEALEKCEFALSEIARFIKPMANDPSLVAARAVLAKAREAGK
jgi:hypothetical protein